MIERIRAACRAFRDPTPEAADEEPSEPTIDAPCPKCSRQGEEIVQQHAGPLTKTHYCRPCQKFFRPQVQ